MGAVNFNVIHTILQTVVSKTGLASLVVEHKGDIPSFGVSKYIKSLWFLKLYDNDVYGLV